MERNIPRNEKQRPATKTTLPSKALNSNGRPNKEFPRQKKAERIQLLQTSSAIYAKVTALRKRRKTVRERGTQVEGSKMAMNNNNLSIITLNVNRLNAPIKRHRVAEWIKKHDPYAAYKRPTSEQKSYTD